MKKGDISSQACMYILGAVIISVTIIIGYQMIGSFRKNAEESVKYDFKLGLERMSREIGTEWGSVKRDSLSLPSQYSHVCFTNSDVITDKTGIMAGISAYSAAAGPGDVTPMVCSLISDSVEDGVMKNVFLVNDKELGESFFIDRIKMWKKSDLESGTTSFFECIENKNGLSLIFMGDGKYAKVAEDTE